MAEFWIAVLCGFVLPVTIVGMFFWYRVTKLKLMAGEDKATGKEDPLHLHTLSERARALQRRVQNLEAILLEETEESEEKNRPG